MLRPIIEIEVHASMGMIADRPPWENRLYEWRYADEDRDCLSIVLTYPRLQSEPLGVPMPLQAGFGYPVWCREEASYAGQFIAGLYLKEFDLVIYQDTMEVFGDP
jgi:hypothetical protein